MKKLLSSLIAVLLVAGCATTPKLPDPTVEYAVPPSDLMQPARQMKEIPVGNNQ